MSEVQTSSVHLSLAKVGAAILVTALLGGFSTVRFKHAGEWAPVMPNTVDIWDSIDTPIDSKVIEGLGNPKSSAKVYVNPLGEKVFASVMSVGPFENYHDPMVCVAGGGSFALTAKKLFPLEPGSGQIRAMVFQRRDSDLRLIMYYWQQSRDGSMDTAARMGNYRDIQARFNTGYGAVIKGQQTCLMRIYAYIDPKYDRNGAQAQRNVEHISRAIYHALRKDAGLE